MTESKPSKRYEFNISLCPRHDNFSSTYEFISLSPEIKLKCSKCKTIFSVSKADLRNWAESSEKNEEYDDCSDVEECIEDLTKDIAAELIEEFFIIEETNGEKEQIIDFLKKNFVYYVNRE